MVIFQRTILSILAVVCVIGSQNRASVACPDAGPDAAQDGRAAGRSTAAGPDRSVPERFMVVDRGCALLGPDGEEKERLESAMNGAGAISPDGRWAAFSRAEPNPPPDRNHGELVIQSRVHPEERRIVPLVWGTTGSSFLPLWSRDSRRILICEQGFNADNSRGSAYRVYDMDSKSLTNVKLKDEWWPSDWSADGRRVLASLRSDNGGVRIAWATVDGTGQPEFITSDQEVAYGAKLSPDNRRILCMAGPRSPDEQEKLMRLYVIDLATKERTRIDKPGHTYGYCWSSDGSKIAYTWQLPLRKPEEAKERRTYLITCDPDGSNAKTITMRKCEVAPNSSGRDAVVIFFQVVAWWR
jgi:Tol biopolymer transport system component